jgi:hypothetical protein
MLDRAQYCLDAARDCLAIGDVRDASMWIRRASRHIRDDIPPDYHSGNRGAWHRYWDLRDQAVAIALSMPRGSE